MHATSLDYVTVKTLDGLKRIPLSTNQPFIRLNHEYNFICRFIDLRKLGSCRSNVQLKKGYRSFPIFSAHRANAHLLFQIASCKGHYTGHVTSASQCLQ